MRSNRSNGTTGNARIVQLGQALAEVTRRLGREATGDQLAHQNEAFATRIADLERQVAEAEERLARESAELDQAAQQEAARACRLEDELREARWRLTQETAQGQALQRQLTEQNNERRSLVFYHDQQLRDRVHRQVVAERQTVDGPPCYQPGHQPSYQMRMIRRAVAAIAAIGISWWLLAHLLVVAAVIGVLAFLAGGRR